MSEIQTKFSGFQAIHKSGWNLKKKHLDFRHILTRNGLKIEIVKQLWNMNCLEPKQLLSVWNPNYSEHLKSRLVLNLDSHCIRLVWILAVQLPKKASRFLTSGFQRCTLVQTSDTFWINFCCGTLRKRTYKIECRSCRLFNQIFVLCYFLKGLKHNLS